MLKVPSKSPHILISKVAILLVWFCLFNVCYAQSSDDASSVQLQVRVFLEGLIESRTPEMVRVNAGQFIIGTSGESGIADQKNPEPRHRLWNAGNIEIGESSERPQQSVTIPHPFEVSRHEITRAQFKYFLDNNPTLDAHSNWGDPAYFEQNAMHPAIFVSWNDAKAYVAWLSELTGQTYRLLSEAEWEYMARDGTTSPYHFGNMISTEQANYGRGSTTVVGSFDPNAWGLHDVHGNVYEWVEDCWHQNYNTTPPLDGSAWSTGCSITANRVIRGGSWVSYLDSSFLRSAGRTSKVYRINSNSLGFRIARTLD